MRKKTKKYQANLDIDFSKWNQWFARAVFALFLAPACAQSIFTQAPYAPFNPGMGPYNSVTADFNGDGNLDLAFIDEGNGAVTVLLGDGHGRFTAAPASPFQGGALPVGLIAADFNGDGNTDLAVESSLAGPSYIGQGMILLLLGDGKGGFTLSPPTIQGLTGGSAGPIASGDFNNDGLPDVVISNENGLVIMLSDGKGGLLRAPVPTGSGTLNGQVAVGNFTGSGNSDIAVVNSQGLTVFACDGKNNFTALPGQTFPTIPSPDNIASGDFNGDGFPDLVVADTKNKNVAVLLNNAKGSFSLKTSVPVNAAQSRQPFAIADFNGDGNVDLAVSDGVIINMLLGDGTGAFIAAPNIPFSSTGYISFSVTGDFNNDRKPDLVITDGNVWLNTLPSISANPKIIQFQVGYGQAVPSPIHLTIAPAGTTASSNQAWLSYASGQVSVNPAGLSAGQYKGTIRFNAPNSFGTLVQVSLSVNAPSGTFTTTSNSPPPIAGTPSVGDFNGDGIPDLLAGNNNVLTVWFGDGKGNFTASSSQTMVPSSGPLALGDFNLDGHLDIAFFQFSYSTQTSGFVQSTLTIQTLLGDGTGAFTIGPVSSSAPSSIAFGFAVPLVADFNLDGIPDLFAAGFIFLGDGKGHFREAPPQVEAQTASAATCDFNGDGIPDVAYTELASSRFYVLLGNGRGGLTLSQRYDFAQQDLALGSLICGDWNNDGVPDLAIASSQNPGFIEIMTGGGNGTFGRGASFQSASGTPYVYSIASADFNGDGNLDLLIAYQNSFLVAFGDGHGNFAPSPGGAFPNRAVLTADFNKDGRPDVASTSSAGLIVNLGALAAPTITLTELPPNPFDNGQTVYLSAQVSPAPMAFQSPTGQISLQDGTTAISIQPLASQVTFQAPFLPQTHFFMATYLGDLRDASTSTTLKVIENGPPAAIAALAGLPLQARVIDSNNNPIPEIGVTFSAPTSGPSGSFLGTLGPSPTATVLTDNNGIAAAPLFVSNGISGSYLITAITTIGGLSCTFMAAN
jgi:hypothetical protein